MEYSIKINEFEGPMDLLLHLIKKSEIDIFNINICEITDQYLDYLSKMEELDLDIASEYLTLAAELMEIKSYTLLPKKEKEVEDEEDPKERLVKRLLEYQQYKEITSSFKELEQTRKEYFTKELSDLRVYQEEINEVKLDFSMDDLTHAFEEFLKRKEDSKPLNTKITKKEYSVSIRCNEIRSLLKSKKKINFDELFENFNKEYIIVTFLSILDLAKKQELDINQDDNFNTISLSWKGEF